MRLVDNPMRDQQLLPLAAHRTCVDNRHRQHSAKITRDILGERWICQCQRQFRNQRVIERDRAEPGCRQQPIPLDQRQHQSIGQFADRFPFGQPRT